MTGAPCRGLSDRLGTLGIVTLQRACSKPSCNRPSVATLTYVYQDCTAVLGPLATASEPHCYDLCDTHAERLTAPRGWDVVRLDFDPDLFTPSTDDLEALADAVREAARPKHEPMIEAAVASVGAPAGTVEIVRRGHLRVLRSVD